MAKQIGLIKITGTIHNICYYKMEGQYYARLKSSLDGKRVKTDPAFAGTMRYAELLGMASSLVSKLYHRIPKEERSRELFRKLTGETMRELGGEKRQQATGKRQQAAGKRQKGKKAKRQEVGSKRQEVRSKRQECLPQISQIDR